MYVYTTRIEWKAMELDFFDGWFFGLAVLGWCGVQWWVDYPATYAGIFGEKSERLKSGQEEYMPTTAMDWGVLLLLLSLGKCVPSIHLRWDGLLIPLYYFYYRSRNRIKGTDRMGGGASVHKRRDNTSGSSNDSKLPPSSSQKQTKTSGFRIRRRKQKDTSQPASGLCRSQQGSMGKLEKGKFVAFIHTYK
jgi:hypothetical protein